MKNRLFLSLTDEELKRFEAGCEETGMTRSQYLQYLLAGQKEIRPAVIREPQFILQMSNIERNLKMIAMKDSLSEMDHIKIMAKLEDLKNLIKEN